jgi:hypothetical protein
MKLKGSGVIVFFVENSALFEGVGIIVKVKGIRLPPSPRLRRDRSHEASDFVKTTTDKTVDKKGK